MVYYECYRCGYNSIDKNKLRLHINRINKCKHVLNDIQFKDCKEYILQGMSFEEYQKIKGIINVETPFSQQSVAEQPVNKISLKCNFCEKVLSYKQSYYRHLKTCKKKNTDEENKTDEDVKDSMACLLNSQLNDKNEELNNLKKELKKLLNYKKEELNNLKKELKKQLTKLDKEFQKGLAIRDKQIDALIKKVGINNSTINVQNNIKLISYSDTDRKHLSANDLIKCLKDSNFCIPQLLDKVKRDKNSPENII